jgi:hypothetical protein
VIVVRTLLLNEIEAIGGGHPTVSATGIAGSMIAAAWILIELPHAIHGIIEMYNYSVDWHRTGCTDIDEEDHFKHDVCALFA